MFIIRTLYLYDKNIPVVQSPTVTTVRCTTSDDNTTTLGRVHRGVVGVVVLSYRRHYTVDTSTANCERDLGSERLTNFSCRKKRRLYTGYSSVFSRNSLKLTTFWLLAS